MPSDRDIRGFPAGNGLGIPPIGIPTADQEALQEPAFDPVMLAANVGAGGLLGATEGLDSTGFGFFKHMAKMAWEAPEAFDKYIASPAYKFDLDNALNPSRMVNIFRRGIEPIQPTLGAQAFSQVIGQPLGYGNTYARMPKQIPGVYNLP